MFFRNFGISSNFSNSRRAPGPAWPPRAAPHGDGRGNWPTPTCAWTISPPSERTSRPGSAAAGLDWPRVHGPDARQDRLQMAGQDQLPGRELRHRPGDGHHADLRVVNGQRDGEDAAASRVPALDRLECPGAADLPDEGVPDGVVVEGFWRGGRVGQAVTAGPRQVDVPDAHEVST